MIGVDLSLGSSRISREISNPLVPDKSRSRRMTSGRRSLASRSPPAASNACKTSTRSSPCRRRTATSSWISGASSMTSTTAGGDACGYTLGSNVDMVDAHDVSSNLHRARAARSWTAYAPSRAHFRQCVDRRQQFGVAGPPLENLLDCKGRVRDGREAVAARGSLELMDEARQMLGSRRASLRAERRDAL